MENDSMKIHFMLRFVSKFRVASRLPLALTLAMVVFRCCGFSAANGDDYTPGQNIDKDFDGFAKPFITSHCTDFHSGKEPEGNLALDELGPVDEVNAATWKAYLGAGHFEGDAAQRHGRSQRSFSGCSFQTGSLAS
jgi:hypothetical protein